MRDDMNARLKQLQLMDLSENSLAPQRLDISWEERLAFKLLNGVYQMWGDGRVTFHYLSSKTEPSEHDARIAVASLLLGGKPPAWLLNALAALFMPELMAEPHPHQRRVVFKQVKKGHARPLIDWCIAFRVKCLRDRGDSYEEAVRSVAKLFHRDERHIKKVYARHKKEFTKYPSLVASDTWSDDMASDS